VKLRKSLTINIFSPVLVAGLVLFPPNMLDNDPNDTQFVSEKEVSCLANNIYFESNHQKQIEKESIAHVVLNRVKDSKFPNTICNVVHQAKLDTAGNPRLNKCQFSWYCDGKSDVIKDVVGYGKALRVAVKVIYRRESRLLDPTENSLWYHAHYVNPYWAKTYEYQIRIGSHLFYARE
jgi:spore germination cell wall hydrolase CwlJ-like protein